ncbi:hypothetical protein OTU49_005996 [Cherax quadricarinatus]|uniref:Ancillary SecYEG translocon subunit/Cell division coordinator CpoB TPR domain-containing protein n=1 Tax=Cherax quadricarinatus TaxID=27406 RepID=A0AAW0X1C5_CHEQU
MASLLRSGSFIRFFSGFRQSWTTNVPGCEALTLQKLQMTPVHPSVTRLLSAQKLVENVKGGSSLTQGIDKALYRIDTDIRRTGRIYKKDIEDIFGEIKALKHASSTQSLLLLRCCGSLVPEELPEVRNKLVQEIWDTLHELHIPLDISHYNTLLRVYLENEHKFSPTKFLADLEKNGIEPNRVTYQRLISRYCQEGDIDGATKILEFMKEKQLPVGENIFNSLIMGHSRANDMESAHKVLDVMKGSGLEPSTDTYTTLLVGYAEHGDIESLHSTLAECEAAELNLHDRELMEVVFALAVKGYKQHVPQIIEKFQKVQGYQQDAMNLTYRLLNAECHEVAYQIMSTMKISQNDDGETIPVGFFFIRHLVKSGTPTSVVMQYCQELRKNGQNIYASEVALGGALQYGLPEAAMFIMRVMNEDGASLRPHYFWPIILQYGKQGEIEKVYSTVKEMISFEVPLTLETCKHYVIPTALNHNDQETMIGALREAGMSLSSVINGCIAYHLDNGDIKAAADLVSRYRYRLTSILRHDLANVYVKMGDPVSTVVVLGQMVNHNQDVAIEDQNTEDEGAQQTSGREQQDVAGMFLKDVIWQTHGSPLGTAVLPLLREMVSRGINISKENALLAKSKLEGQATEETVELLERVSSGDLAFQPPPRETLVLYSQQSVSELERRYSELKNKNLPTENIVGHLLIAYIRNKDIEKVEEMKKKLEAEQYPFGIGIYVLLIDMYVSAGKLTEAVKVLQDLVQREPDSKLTPFKFLRLAQLMVQEGQIEDAFKLIESNAPESIDERESVTTTHQCKRILDIFADKGDVATVRRFMDVFLSHRIAQPGSVIFGPLIKAHLNSDDLAGALSDFENIWQEHRVTPSKLELTVHCVKLEDAEKLQKIMDMSIASHGEMNSLYDMVFAFIECGRIKQARKLLETPGLRAFNTKLNIQCQRFLETGRLLELEHLVTVTRDVFDLDRNMMYMHLLTGYKQQNECEKALGIWTSMQEENIEPSETFLIRLGEFLKENGHEVPFIMPEAKQDIIEKEPSVANFRTALTERDFTSAVSIKNKIQLSGGQLNIDDRSKLIEGLVQDSRFGEAASLAREMLSSGTYPHLRILKFLVTNLAKNGDVESVIFLEKYMNDIMKKQIKFDNLLCLAYKVSGRTEEFLENLLIQIQSARTHELESLGIHFPRGGIIGIMEDSPQFLPKVITISEEYASRGLLYPANCVWMHYFSNKRYDEAEEIYKKHLSESSAPLMFRNILDKARKTSNADDLSKLLEILETRSNCTPHSKGLVYSSWIDILVKNKKIDEGLEVLQAALKKLTLVDFNTTALTRLRDGLELSGKSFPYTIPAKERHDRRNKNSDSSSDSD